MIFGYVSGVRVGLGRIPPPLRVGSPGPSRAKFSQQMLDPVDGMMEGAVCPLEHQSGLLSIGVPQALACRPRHEFTHVRHPE